MTATATFRFDNSYVRDLPGFSVPGTPAVAPSPRLLYLNRELADELGADVATLSDADGAALFAGSALPEGAEPVAQVYAGHQFGGFSPQLGDGRALLLGEVVDRHGVRRDIAFKGSGRTPFSRGGDGRATVGPMLREVLIGEAMHALGIPTTRALAVAATGEPVRRETWLPGAVLTRVAASHLRVGTFQYFAARGDTDRLRLLADYAIARHDPSLADTPGPQRYLALLQAVAARQAALVAQWMNVGFIHGVMNTDNMTISGETIDYGPCAFMEAFDAQAVFSSIDHGGRYVYGNQPGVANWNLARLAETLLPLIAEDDSEAATARAMEDATAVLRGFELLYAAQWLGGQRAKLGLRHPAATAPNDAAGANVDTDPADRRLADDWLALLQAEHVDYTLAWRRLADAAAGDDAPLRALFTQQEAPSAWLARWRERCAVDDGERGDRNGGGAAAEPGDRADRMRRVNPFVIPRNHRVEEALTAAALRDDLQPFQRLLAALRRPYDESPEQAPYGDPAEAAVTAAYQTFCGT